jgi:hypothetical protein
MFQLGYLAVVRLIKTANRTLLILQLMLLAAATTGCMSLLSDSLDATLDSAAHPHESQFDKFLRQSDEEQAHREHPEWQQ